MRKDELMIWCENWKWEEWIRMGIKSGWRKWVERGGSINLWGMGIIMICCEWWDCDCACDELYEYLSEVVESHLSCSSHEIIIIKITLLNKILPLHPSCAFLNAVSIFFYSQVQNRWKHICWIYKFVKIVKSTLNRRWLYSHFSCP